MSQPFQRINSVKLRHATVPLGGTYSRLHRGWGQYDAMHSKHITIVHAYTPHRINLPNLRPRCFTRTPLLWVPRLGVFGAVVSSEPSKSPTARQAASRGTQSLLSYPSTSGYRIHSSRRPCGGSVVPARVRSVLAMMSGMDSASILPRPTSMSVPAMMRTML